MIHIRLLNKKLLHEFINSKAYNELKYLPISRHRAISHIKNPRAESEDVLLLLAYEENELVGYLGVLPDLIHYNNNFEKCGWLSCLWIDTAHRGKKIALKLVQKAIEVWNKRILVTEFTGPAKRLYDKTENFVSLENKNGIRLYVRFDLQKILPPKKPIFQKIKPLLQLSDFAGNLFFDVRFIFFKTRLDNYRLEYIKEIDEKLYEFINAKQSKQIFKRGIEELNWIINNPWVISTPTEDNYEERYHFSAIDKLFEFVPVKVYDSDKRLKAFLMFARRNNDLKLPYCYGDDISSILEVINYHIIKWRINTFTTFHKRLVQQLKHARTPSIFKKEIQRNYIISSTFNPDNLGESFEIQDGDADCSFT